MPLIGNSWDSRIILAGDINISVTPFSWNSPSLTNLKDFIHAPSSSSVLENGGIEPGVIPPIMLALP